MEIFDFISNTPFYYTVTKIKSKFGLNLYEAPLHKSVLVCWSLSYATLHGYHAQYAK